MRRFRQLQPLVLALGLLIPLYGARSASAIDFGVRAGAYVEDQDPFVGLELLSAMGSSDWYFNPNVEFVFAEERDRVALSFDFHYDFLRTGSYYVWGGGGLAGIHTDSGRGQGSKTDLGIDLLGGVGWRLEGFTPYAQLKIVVAEDSELVAGVGIRF